MPSIVTGQAGRNSNQMGKGMTSAVGSPSYWATQTYLNPAAFTVLNAGTAAQYGTQAGQNGQVVYVGNGPANYVPGNAARVGALNVWSMGSYDLDMNVKRTFNIYKEWKLAFQADCFNVTNHVYFGALNGGVGGSSFGQVAGPPGVNLPRVFQFSGRFSF
jgi:hypothetical protein